MTHCKPDLIVRTWAVDHVEVRPEVRLPLWSAGMLGRPSTRVVGVFEACWWNLIWVRVAEDGRSRSSFTEDGYWWLILLFSSVAVSLCVQVQVPCWSSRVDFALVQRWWLGELMVRWSLDLSIDLSISPVECYPLHKIDGVPATKATGRLDYCLCMRGTLPYTVEISHIINHQQWWSSADYWSRFLSPKEFSMACPTPLRIACFKAQKRSAHLFAIHRNARPLVVSWLQTLVLQVWTSGRNQENKKSSWKTVWGFGKFCLVRNFSIWFQRDEKSPMKYILVEEYHGISEVLDHSAAISTTQISQPWVLGSKLKDSWLVWLVWLVWLDQDIHDWLIQIIDPESKVVRFPWTQVCRKVQIRIIGLNAKRVV